MAKNKSNKKKNQAVTKSSDKKVIHIEKIKDIDIGVYCKQIMQIYGVLKMPLILL